MTVDITPQPVGLMLKRLWRQITGRRRVHLALLFFLMLFASLAEICSLAAVLPFLSVLSTPEKVLASPFARSTLEIFGSASTGRALLLLGMVFGVAVITAGAVRILLLWVSSRLTYSIGADLSFSIYRRTLYQPYAVHCSRNSSEIIDGISNKSYVVINIISHSLTFVSSCLFLLGILLVLVSVSPLIALSAFGGFGLIYFLIVRFFRERLLLNSARVALESTKVIKSIQEGLGGIRDILIDGSQEAYCLVYRSADLRLRHAQGSSAFIQLSPRYAVEAFGMVLIAGLAYSLAQQSDGFAKAIPVLGALALGAQRLLPLMQQCYVAYVGIQSCRVSIQDALDLLEQTLPVHVGESKLSPIRFEKTIRLENLYFSYSHRSPDVLQGIDLVVEKGSCVGFIGVTGSGKSTLLDLIMGLLRPTSGSIRVDDEVLGPMNYRNWQARIAHVPQTIFLSDCSIAENIAFGIPKESIDHIRVQEASKQAQIASTIESWPNGYETIVGERGVRLSGGQRQRIGIARAFYKKADVIVFDEATSALDSETESDVMQAIKSLQKDLTLIIIAHRVSTLKNCTKIVELVDKKINRVCSYKEIEVATR